MSKTILVIIGVIIASGLLYTVFTNKFGKQTMVVSQETIKKLQENKPVLSQQDEQFLEKLTQNALSGGPPKDGIPAIDKPQYTDAQEADTWLLPEDAVFGVDYKGFVAAYPQRILVWHEILNDIVNGERLSITYCPLTGTAIGFKGQIVKDLSSTFGVSGKLVNSNLIMYDRETDSYWPQILGKAITEPAKGRKLEEFPVVWTTWERWKRKYPTTKVLSRNTGFLRNYDVSADPYKGYYVSDRLIFEPLNKDNRLPNKTVVVGVRDEKGNAVAVLKDFLRKQKTVEASLGEKRVVLTYDEELDSHKATFKETGGQINSFDAMWFAWVAFYPNTQRIN